MSWDVHALLTHPLQLFNAPIFWPRSLTLAYSDLLLPAAPIYGLLHTVTGSSVAALNLTNLLLMVFTQATTYALTKRLTGRDDAAILAALAFTFSGYALAHWGHPQLQLMGMLPLGFLLLFRLLDAPTTRNAVLFGVVAAAIALGALYYGVVFAVCAGVVLLGHLLVAALPAEARVLERHRDQRGRGRRAGGAVRGRVRAASVATGFRSPVGARVGAQGRRPLHARAAQLPVRLDGAHRSRARRRAHALPRLLVLLLAAVGLVVAIRRRAGQSWRDDLQDGEEPIEARRHRELRLLLLAGAASLVLAIGPEVYGVTAPFGLLHDHVPGFSGIRVSARLAVVAWLTLAVLAGKGFAVLTRRASAGVARRWSLSRSACSSSSSWRHQSSPRRSRRATRPSTCTGRSPTAGSEAVVELPMVPPISQPLRVGDGGSPAHALRRRSTGIHASTGTRATSRPATQRTSSCSTRSRRPSRSPGCTRSTCGTSCSISA